MNSVAGQCVTGNRIASRRHPERPRLLHLGRKEMAAGEKATEIRAGHMNVGPVCVSSKPLMS